MQEISLEKLLETGAYFGHQTRRWNPKMTEYVYAVRDGVHIFDLIKTKQAIAEALEALKDASKTQKTILFVGPKKQSREAIREVATVTGYPFVNQRWLGGTLTNFDQIKSSVEQLETLKKDLESGEYKDYTKKERLLIERRIEKLEKFVGGLSNLKEIPDLIFIVDTHRERGAVIEAQKLGIPIVGIVDTNADPTEIDYPIPMNDDATAAISYVLELVKESVLEGKSKKTKTEKSSDTKKKTKKTKSKK